MPSRPQPADAAQEGALANLKSDLRMALDAVPSSDVARRLEELTERYAAVGNALAVWLLLGTDWGALYCETRGLDTTEWTARLSGIDPGGPDDDQAEAQARKLLEIVTGPKGMLGTVTAAANLVRMRLDQLGLVRDSTTGWFYDGPVR